VILYSPHVEEEEEEEKKNYQKISLHQKETPDPKKKKPTSLILSTP
jgi:hypothetical protein